MVIPYMPMLVPPLNWTGYGKISYLLSVLPYFIVVHFLKSFIRSSYMIRFKAL